MIDSFKNYQAICEAISLLFPTQIEIVIHDLETQQIAHIENSFSNRVVGEQSLIDLEELEVEIEGKQVIGPYAKSTPEGESIKSITIVIREESGNPLQLLCINMKTEILEKSVALIEALTGIDSSARSNALLTGDWRERANDIIACSLNELGMPMHATKRVEKMIIVKSLDENEIFQIRGSTTYIASAIGSSRASLYSLLRDIRNN
jgi:predicted transcriptional regulator YheO